MEKQVLTTKQMQELIELGIDTSKASCTWCKVSAPNKNGYTWMVLPENLGKNDKEHVPTFTFYDIITMLPTTIDYNGTKRLRIIPPYTVEYTNSKMEGKIIVESSLLLSAFEMLKCLKKNGRLWAYNDNFSSSVFIYRR